MNRVNSGESLSERERRDRFERRRRMWWSVCYGSFNPRRRTPPRRLSDSRHQFLDWHSSHLLAVALGILLLSAVDAFLTLALLQVGAYEANPLMAPLLARDVAAFATLKIALTGVCTVFMVVMARYRFMRLVRVEWVLYGILIAYVSLIGYEMSMLNTLPELPLL